MSPHGSVLLSLAILLAAFAALLASPALSLAKGTTSGCSPATTHTKQPVRACAGRTRSGNSHGKAKRRHSGRHRPIHKKKKKATHHGSVQPPVAAAPKPATCEDRSRPVSEGEGSFSCANGAEPVCASGAQPALSKNGAKLLCPVPPASGSEWSEAECEDGSAPERAGDGSFACEDGSQPACTDGSTPRLSDDGSMLVCLVHGAPPSSSGGEADEVEEDEAEAGAESASAATAS
jgi:hypothetical protein